VADEEKHGSPEISRYEFSGIEERHGRIPVWLAVVYAAMLLWMVYYLIRFWTDRG
jgi:hypothetical protein